MHKLHEIFIALAAQLYEIHEAVKVNPLENCILGGHFPKHPSSIDSSHSPSPRKQCCVFKKSLIPGRLQEAALNWGKGISFRKAVVLEIVLLRRIVYIMGKTFSSSFVRDCSLFQDLRWSEGEKKTASAEKGKTEKWKETWNGEGYSALSPPSPCVLCLASAFLFASLDWAELEQTNSWIKYGPRIYPSDYDFICLVPLRRFPRPSPSIHLVTYPRQTGRPCDPKRIRRAG